MKTKKKLRFTIKHKTNLAIDKFQKISFFQTS